MKKNKIELKHNLQKLKAEFANTILDTKSDEINWQEIKEKKIKILADIQIIKGKILLIDLEISTLPPEIKFDEAHQGVKLCVIDYEKKRFLDCIKIYCYIIQKKMCEILSKYYDNPKDIWTILAMIVRRGTEVKLERNILTIRFKKFTNEVVEYAARHLCEELNNMTPITLDKFSFKLKYMVE